MIVLEKGVPSVYVDESRDFQYFLRAYDTVFNMVKHDTDTLKYLTSTKECQSKVLSLLKSKLGFFTNYSFNDDMLRGILSGFPTMIKNKGSLEAIQEALSIFLKVLNIRTEIILKATGSESETIKGSIEIDDHTILIAINSAIQNFYILEELFRYIMPVGYQYTFYFYKELEEESWILDKSTGRFLIVNTLVSDSIRTDSLYNQSYNHDYDDKFIDNMINQVNTINLFDKYELDTSDFVLVELTYEPECFENNYYFFYKLENNKYVQLTAPEVFNENIKYYIPQFLFVINEDDTYYLDENDEKKCYYELVHDRPQVVNIGAHYRGAGHNQQFEYDEFTQNYFNYYRLGYIDEQTGQYVNDGKFRNLTEPVPFEPDKYYRVKTSRFRVIADDVISYSAIPLTAEYVSTIAEFLNN